MHQKKRTRTERFLDDVMKLVKEFSFLDSEVTKSFMKLVKKHADEIDNKISTNFIEMVQKRQAAKFVNMSQEEFEAKLKEEYAKQMAIFKRSRTLSEDDIEEVERMKRKAQETKAKKASAKEDAKKDINAYMNS